MSLKMVNGNIAVLPIVLDTPNTKEQEQSKRIGFVAMDKLFSPLLSSKVVHGDGKDFNPGDTVYVKTDITNHPFFRQKFKLDDVEFILVPTNLVVGVKPCN